MPATLTLADELLPMAQALTRDTGESLEALVARLVLEAFAHQSVGEEDVETRKQRTREAVAHLRGSLNLPPNSDYRALRMQGWEKRYGS